MSTKEAFQELQFLKDILNILKDGDTEKDMAEKKKKTMSKRKQKYS